MRSLWLAWLPLLFLPNLGFGGPTPFGVLELSDFLIGPFLVLVAWAGRGHRRGRLTIQELLPLLVGFAGWTALGTLLIRERFDYAAHTAVFVGITKLGRLACYGTAGVLTAKALADESQRDRYPLSLLAAGIVTGVSLFVAQEPTDPLHVSDRAFQGYKAVNAISVMMAMLICYLGGLWVGGRGSHRWRALAGPGLVVMTVGFLLSQGRGGWVAAAVGVSYQAYRRGLKTRALVFLVGGVLVIASAYHMLPDFQTEVDRTLWPDRDYLDRYHMGVAGMDDGARLSTWAHELHAFARNPLLGTGFFHRGGSSGLWATGSHNFFLQMFLETGLVGGLLVLGAFRRMWRLAGSPRARAIGEDVPVHSALIAALVGGLTGEYFYGGMVLMTLLLVFAPVGGLAVEFAHPEHSSLDLDLATSLDGHES